MNTWWYPYLEPWIETPPQPDYNSELAPDWDQELDARLQAIADRINAQEQKADNTRLYSGNTVGKRTKTVLSHCHPVLALLHYTAIPRDPNNYGVIGGRRSLEQQLEIMQGQDPNHPVTWVKQPQDSLHVGRKAKPDGRFMSWATDIGISKGGSYRHESNFYIQTWQQAVLPAALDLGISVFSGGRWDTPNALELNNGVDYAHTHLDPARYPWVEIDSE